MVAAQGTIQNGIDTCTGLFNSMTEQQGTLAANWTGETASAFGQALAAWLSDFQTVISSLQGFLTVMSQNTGVYTATDDANQQAAGNVANNMNPPVGLPALG